MIPLIAAIVTCLLAAAVVLEERVTAPAAPQRAEPQPAPPAGANTASTPMLPATPSSLEGLARLLRDEETAFERACPDGHPGCLPIRGSVNRYFCRECERAFLNVSHDLPLVEVQPDRNAIICPHEGCHAVQPRGAEACAACGFRFTSAGR